MELGTHELEGWEGPTRGEVAKEVAVEVCQGVMVCGRAIYIHAPGDFVLSKQLLEMANAVNEQL